jgi:hypothetical protein
MARQPQTAATRLCHGAGQHDAQQQPGHHGADDAAALGLRREVGGERDEDLCDDRGHPDEHGHGEEQPEVRHHGRRAQRDRGDQEGARGERPVFQQVTDGHQHEHAEGVTELGDRHHERRAALADLERRGDRREQGLRVVDVGDGQATRDGQDQDHPAQASLTESRMCLGCQGVHVIFSHPTTSRLNERRVQYMWGLLSSGAPGEWHHAEGSPARATVAGQPLLANLEHVPRYDLRGCPLAVRATPSKMSGKLAYRPGGSAHSCCNVRGLTAIRHAAGSVIAWAITCHFSAG